MDKITCFALDACCGKHDMRSQWDLSILGSSHHFIYIMFINIHLSRYEGDETVSCRLHAIFSPSKTFWYFKSLQLHDWGRDPSQNFSPSDVLMFQSQMIKDNITFSDLDPQPTSVKQKFDHVYVCVSLSTTLSVSVTHTHQTTRPEDKSTSTNKFSQVYYLPL